MQRFDTKRHDTIGESNMKMGDKEMENQEEVIDMMMMMFNRMLQEQGAMTEIKSAVERLVQRNKQFNGNDLLHYVRDHKAEMMW